MSAATALVPTEHASRYLQQLCKHWAHKLAVTFDDRQGEISFPDGGTATLTAGPDALAVRLDAADADTVERLKRVVADHLDRFAFREGPLTFEWKEG